MRVYIVIRIYKIKAGYGRVYTRGNEIETETGPEMFSVFYGFSLSCSVVFGDNCPSRVFKFEIEHLHSRQRNRIRKRAHRRSNQLQLIDGTRLG
jgi:hypothetical protein